MDAETTNLRLENGLREQIKRMGQEGTLDPYEWYCNAERAFMPVTQAARIRLFPVACRITRLQGQQRERAVMVHGMAQGIDIVLEARMTVFANSVIWYTEIGIC